MASAHPNGNGSHNQLVPQEMHAMGHMSDNMPPRNVKLFSEFSNILLVSIQTFIVI